MNFQIQPRHDYTILEWRHGKWYTWYMVREKAGVDHMGMWDRERPVRFEKMNPQPEAPKL